MISLVTGGAGLIGSHIVDGLLEAGREVRVLDNLEPQTHPEGAPDWIPDDVEFVAGDIRDKRALEQSLRGVDEIFHQAAFGGFTTEISTYLDANSTGTARLFELIDEQAQPVRKVVVASSQAIYGEGLYRCGLHGVVQPAMRTLAQLERAEWEPGCPTCGESLMPELTHEHARWNGETPYAVSKLAEERLTIGMGKRLDLPTVALRYAVTYGPRQSIFNPYTGVASIFSTLLLNGIEPTVYEDGHQTRDFTFVRDIASANLLAMRDDRADWRVFNVGRGEPVTVVELIERLAQAYGLDPSFRITREFRPGDVRHLVHDASSIRELGWKPETTLEEGLAEFVSWISTLGRPKEYFSAALEGLRARGVVIKTGAR
jgi:dTDP-L-rhamnose 4-epimerase